MSQIAYCYIGDCRFNTADTLMIGGCQLGMDVRLCAPEALWPAPALVERARGIAADTGARLTLTADQAEAVRGVDFIHSDVWVSMGEPDSVWAERIEQLLPYQVNRRLLELSGNPAVKFMHCLPAFHNRETEVGEQVHQKFGVEAMEVTDEVFESKASIVFAQAENRMHTIKAVLVATLA
jgi:ornithine carbamoyltransferase